MQNGENSIQVIAKYQVGKEPRFIYFFQEGSLVAWNVSDLEIENLLEFLKQFEIKPYEKAVVLNEKELMNYTYSPNIKVSQLKRDSICLVENSPDDMLSKYTISNAMALSVKLGIWEAALDKYVDSIEYITEDLKSGKKISISRREVLQKTGQLFALRHSINLDSDLLDTPDFYWERDDLENLYLQTCNYFSISRRTKVMNEKLNHCLELVDLLSSHLSDKHHIRLEWMIIVLIMIEVAFEALHYSHLIIWPFAFTEYILPEIKPV
ncbi:required for meiotic nuclear division protein 1 homolog [Diaphorina citri]|uniref:Required for meiotic nuclear division protein 1 homolog n=1 Tax=Diaphorina citri TaxID=121845 RepID=A0A1S4EID3_DIACI|nr:required for meiotic nuclear division protein 1 homolog [Diaphorina citri]